MPEVRGSFYTTFHHVYGAIQTEDVACALCGAQQFRLLGREDIFEIRRCTACTLVYVSPQPSAESLPAFYEGMYEDASEQEVAARSLGAVEKHIRRICLMRKPAGGILCDVGCGFGRFLHAMEATPFALQGVELSEQARAYAQRLAPGALLHAGTAETAAFEPESFDCITLIAVFEYVKDPTRVMANLHTWLKPGGLLVVQVPYIQHFFGLSRALPVGPRIAFEAPRHLFDFSPKTLARFFREAGFQDIRTEIARPYASASALGHAAIWAVKLPGMLLWKLSGGRYVYPFAAAIVVHGVKPSA